MQEVVEAALAGRIVEGHVAGAVDQQAGVVHRQAPAAAAITDGHTSRPLLLLHQKQLL